MAIMSFLSDIVLTSATTSNTVATAIQGVDLSGILNEILALHPTLLPIIVAFIGVRKALSFLIGSLRRGVILITIFPKKL